jgi:VIT1/CCC1 family predicted Fe2+/Mn2+ transporter
VAGGLARPFLGARRPRGTRGPRFEVHGGEHRHRDVRGGGARAAVFGVSDGLVSNASLVLGMAGAHPAGGVVRLAGLAGLVAGAFSMAAGEYVSMRAQSELLERELAVERAEIARRPDSERRELVRIYESRGVPSHLARELAEELMADPEVALETHAREELGIDPAELGSPVQAAVSSFVAFSLGAFVPLLPFLLSSGTAAVLAVVAGAGLAAAVIGAVLSVFTGRSWWWSALRQLLICGLSGAATFGIGTAVGVRGV